MSKITSATVTIPTTTTNTTAAINPGYHHSFGPVSPNVWQTANSLPNYQPGIYPNPGGSGPYVTTPTPPTEGMVININNVVYRYSAGSNEWIKVNDLSDAEVAEVPTIPVELDAKAMLDALRQYRAFLEDLDGLENGVGEIVDDVVFGLRESIEALEKL